MIQALLRANVTQASTIEGHDTGAAAQHKMALVPRQISKAVLSSQFTRQRSTGTELLLRLRCNESGAESCAGQCEETQTLNQNGDVLTNTTRNRVVNGRGNIHQIGRAHV